MRIEQLLEKRNATQLSFEKAIVGIGLHSVSDVCKNSGECERYSSTDTFNINCVCACACACR